MLPHFVRIKMELTQYRKYTCICSFFYTSCRRSILLDQCWQRGGDHVTHPHHTRSPGHVVIPRRWSPSNECQSHSQPACTWDPPAGTTGLCGLQCELNPLHYEALPQEYEVPLAPSRGHLGCLPSCWRLPEVRFCPPGQKLWRSSPHDGKHASWAQGPPPIPQYMRIRVGPYTMQVDKTLMRDQGTQTSEAAVASQSTNWGRLTEPGTLGSEPSTLSMCTHGFFPWSGCHFSCQWGYQSQATSWLPPHCTICCSRWVSTKYIL